MSHLDNFKQNGDLSGAHDFATGMLRELIALFTLRKSKTLNVVFFSQLCGTRFPALGWRLLPDLVRSVPAARSLFISLELMVVAQDILRHAAQAVCAQPLAAESIPFSLFFHGLSDLLP